MSSICTLPPFWAQWVAHFCAKAPGKVEAGRGRNRAYYGRVSRLMRELCGPCIFGLFIEPTSAASTPMNEGHSHTYKAFLAMMVMDAEADARANPGNQKAPPTNGVRFSNAALIRSKSATGAALITRFPGSLSNAAQSTLP